MPSKQARVVYVCESCGDNTYAEGKCDECFAVENTTDSDYQQQMAKRAKLANKLDAETRIARQRIIEAERTQRKLEERYAKQRAERLERERLEREQKEKELNDYYERLRQAKLQRELAAQQAKDNQFMQALVGCLQALGFELVEQPSDKAKIKRLRAELAKLIRRVG